MTGKSGASGGAREGAGRPLASYKGIQYTGETPLEDLWRYLTEKYGEADAKEIHMYFNERKRAYERKRYAKRFSRE